MKKDHGKTLNVYSHNLVRQDMKRMFARPYIYISFVVSLCILLHPFKSIFIDKPSGTFMEFMAVPFATSDYTPFAAIFCVIPFASSICEDFESGYSNVIAVRVGANKYACQRCLAVMLSGGILMFAVVSTVMAICALLANTPETAQSAAFLKDTIWAKMGIVMLCHGVVLVALKSLIAFLFGALWALVGLIIAVISLNQYVTYIGPFVIYQLLWFLLEGSTYNPVYMLRGDSNFIPSLEFIVIYQSVLILGSFLVSYRGIRRRVSA